MRKIIASSTIAASVLGAGFGAVALGPGLAGAQDGPSTEYPAAETDTADASMGIAAVLADLVADGTLDQTQADAVETALRTAAQEGRLGPGHGHRHGDGHARFGRAGATLEELGLDPEVVREGLQNGMTLGEIAEANGSSADAVAEAIVEHMQERLDAAVEAGRIDEATATERAEAIEERADAIVNGEIELGRKGRVGGRGFGAGDRPGPFGGAGADEDTAA